MTSKQRAYLRSLANTEEPVAHIGKEGLTDQVIRSVEEVLEARELIKVQVFKNAPESVRAYCDALVEATHAEPVQCIGNRFVVYRQAREPQKRKIVVPKN